MSKQTAIVTGGAAGLGLATAQALVQRNYNTVVFDIDGSKLGELSPDVVGIEVDVTDETKVQEAVEQVSREIGKIDVVINNAGNIYSSPLINIMNSDRPRHSFQAFKDCIDINLNSVFLVGSIVAEQMIKCRTKGVIINLSSICARGNAGQSAYSASKAGVEALTKVWSKELGIFGIRTVAIAPGFIDTPSTRQALNSLKLDKICSETPLRRLGNPGDVVNAILGVLDNDYLNGTVIEVNGGLVV